MARKEGGPYAVPVCSQIVRQVTESLRRVPKAVQQQNPLQTATRVINWTCARNDRDGQQLHSGVRGFLHDFDRGLLVESGCLDPLG